MSLLERIQGPGDLKLLPEEDLPQLCRELRNEVIRVITSSGGHLAASLGVVELTVALHRVFDSPRDKMIWDVGHQGYIHKLLTGRQSEFETVRQFGGLSGFLKREESEHDAFGAGHASTSISAALGFAYAAKRRKERRETIAIIGDGSLTGGLAFEGLNHGGASGLDLLVILNDNQMSISPNVGALSHYFTEVNLHPFVNRLRDQVWEATGKLGGRNKDRSRELARRMFESLSSLVLPGIFFNELGYRYFGPIDGHDLSAMTHTLERLHKIRGPRLLHVVTKKGKGLPIAERNPVKYHGIGGNLRETAPQDMLETEQPKAPSYNNLLPVILEELLPKHEGLFAITAAMAEGTGLAPLAAAHPERVVDVGIAEGHAVTFAAGAAAAGQLPVVAVYSTFMQRAVDNVIHDVALQKLPVIFALDRAGLVGADGPTHHGNFDLSYMGMVPGMVVTAPADGNEFRALLHLAVSHSGPFCIRYPKDNSYAFDPALPVEPIALGSWKRLRVGNRLRFLAVGSMVRECLDAAELLAEHKVEAEVINCRFIKPMDQQILAELAACPLPLITVEENCPRGGFGEALRGELACLGRTRGLYHMSLPDQWVEHGGRRLLLDQVGLTGQRIAERVLALLEN